MKKRELVNSITIICILLILSGCGTKNISITDKSEIYQLIIHKMFSKDNSFGKAVDIHFLYINKWTRDYFDKGNNITPQPTQQLSKEIMNQIDIKLSDLPVQILWINDNREVLPTPGRPVKDGAIVTLGNIHFETIIKVNVEITIYYAGLAAAGGTYSLQKENNAWKIIGLGNYRVS
jgi:hypothetical protein